MAPTSDAAAGRVHMGPYSDRPRILGHGGAGMTQDPSLSPERWLSSRTGSPTPRPRWPRCRPSWQRPRTHRRRCTAEHRTARYADPDRPVRRRRRQRGGDGEDPRLAEPGGAGASARPCWEASFARPAVADVAGPAGRAASARADRLPARHLQPQRLRAVHPADGFDGPDRGVGVAARARSPARSSRQCSSSACFRVRTLRPADRDPQVGQGRDRHQQRHPVSGHLLQRHDLQQHADATAERLGHDHDLVQRAGYTNKVDYILDGTHGSLKFRGLRYGNGVILADSRKPSGRCA